VRKRVVVIGAVLAVAIAAAVVLISFNDCSAKSDACPGDWVTPGLGNVLVATRDIQPGESIDALIETGGIIEYMVPLETLVAGAARDVSQIEGRTATRHIGKDEQISNENLSRG
jgi:flagella basal body P-ring formation protein FlgA